MNLYQPDKYKVFTGKGKNLGLCTVWNEPEIIFNKLKGAQDKIAILGTLYSRQGVNVIIRNLALNPSINRLLIWGSGPLSSTQFGLMGRSVLEKVWQDGVEPDGTVRGMTFKLEKEIDPEVVNKMRENVQYIDVSDKSLPEVLKIIEEEENKTEKEEYMESVSWPEAEVEEVEVFPSEEVGWIVRDKKVLNAWSRVVERIMRYGTIKGTQYGYKQRELIGVTWVIGEEDPDNPDFSLAEDWPEDVKKVTGADKESLEEYKKEFLEHDLPEGTSYTYGNRLMRYPAEGGFVDQVEEVIIKQLKSSPDSRRATATTMVPGIDKDNKQPPCITQIQVLQSSGRVHLLCTLRSHDIFKAAISNAFGLLALQKKIAESLGISRGYLQISSQSAHIYEQDWEEAMKMTRCFYLERKPSLVFNQDADADQRGNFVISIADKIRAVFQGPTGEILMEIEGKTAKEISKKIAQLELLSRSDHMMDVAMELMKAEIALKKGLEYHQDKPLVF